MPAPRNVSDYLYQCHRIGVVFVADGDSAIPIGPPESLDAVQLGGFLPVYESAILERLAPAPWDAPEFRALARAQEAATAELDEYDVEERAAMIRDGDEGITQADALAVARRQLAELAARSSLAHVQ